jgi:hypothetical protein
MNKDNFPLDKHSQEFLDMCLFAQDASCEHERRMHFLEEMKYDLTRHCYSVPTPRIMRDITKLFHAEVYLFFDHIILFINCYKDCVQTVEWTDYIKLYLETMKKVFDGSLISDPVINPDTLSIVLPQL